MPKSPVSRNLVGEGTVIPTIEDDGTTVQKQVFRKDQAGKPKGKVAPDIRAGIIVGALDGSFIKKIRRRSFYNLNCRIAVGGQGVILKRSKKKQEKTTENTKEPFGN